MPLEPNQILLTNVRLSYPNLFKPYAMEEGQEPKYSASLILDKRAHSSLIKKLDKLIDEHVQKFWGGKVPRSALKGVCLRDGMEKADKDGYGEEVVFVPASSTRRPTVVDRNKQIPLVETDGRPYAGCYVNAIVSLWKQDNKWGKRVNANLSVVQFVRDGEPFGEKVDMDVLPDEDDGEDSDPLG